jgi:phage/plasmid primase-like uncharacterized protein
MDFLDHCRACGLIVHRLLEDGRIHRVPTTEKPRSDNGAYRFFGRWGWAMDWSAHSEPVIWSDGKPGVEQARQQDLARFAQAEEAARARATERARAIVNRSKYDWHPYLASKGVPTQMLVDGDGSLVVPMWSASGSGPLVNVQRIGADGTKLFLKGGQAKHTAHVLGPRVGKIWWCEGLATGLTILKALKYMSTQGRVICTFFASNLAHAHGPGYVFADHDRPNPQTGKRAGEEAAIATGLPWCQSPVEGEDANDLYQRTNIKAVADLMREAMQR